MRSASRVVLFAIASGASGVSVAVIGCMGEGTLCPAPSAAAATDAQADADAAPPTTLAWLRLANLSPTAPNVDFCVAPVTSVGQGMFQGPLIAQLASRLTAAGTQVPANMGGSGLAFMQASAYVGVASQQAYVVRIVGGNAGSCAAGILPDLTTLPMPPPDAGLALHSALATNEFLTIALLGEQLPPNTLQAIALVDDPAVDAGTSASKAYLRFLHAAVGQPPVDVYKGLITPTTPILFSGIGYGQVSAPPANPEAGVPVDFNGYWVTSPFSGAIDVYDAGLEAGAAVATATLAVAGGAVVTLALVGDSVLNDAGIGNAPYQLLMCVDNGATTAVLANCTTPPP